MDIGAVHAVSPCQRSAVEQMVPFAEQPNHWHLQIGRLAIWRILPRAGLRPRSLGVPQQVRAC